jgi:hypothetical protein
MKLILIPYIYTTSTLPLSLIDAVVQQAQWYTSDGFELDFVTV